MLCYVSRQYILEEDFINAPHSLYLVLFDFQFTLPKEVSSRGIFHLPIQNVEYKTNECEQISNLKKTVNAVMSVKIVFAFSLFIKFGKLVKKGDSRQTCFRRRRETSRRENSAFSYLLIIFDRTVQPYSGCLRER